ncbi:hypothetical protein SAMN02910447_00625 [Ruminococcus sp. YE71]|uniref:hypothetical protein n=1 Tax=unclassified Ruminococcus TaxID=2608920 RepID=UPI000888A5AA|nr:MULTISPECIES: hypothetical protein [unclassified Ruminococcus]SDA13191.1 hypothetical protein SAMN02910446_00624 [Ruminococcus sp. YE78]SFW18614.1 hypothetical protein SAMN02910447_00625 [Ruminococcus sp. YE71]
MTKKNRFVQAGLTAVLAASLMVTLSVSADSSKEQETAPEEQKIETPVTDDRTEVAEVYVTDDAQECEVATDENDEELTEEELAKLGITVTKIDADGGIAANGETVDYYKIDAEGMTDAELTEENLAKLGITVTEIDADGGFVDGGEAAEYYTIDTEGMTDEELANIGVYAVDYDGSETVEAPVK